MEDGFDGLAGNALRYAERRWDLPLPRLHRLL
jgi:hypothetical protein